ISSAGSGFDTLLGVYQGQAITSLAPVENDDNSAGFHNSSVTFNAIAGAEYVISIGGYAGDFGNLVLCFSLEPTADRVPKIFAQPQSKTAPPNGPVKFVVQNDPADPVLYQWFLNDKPLPGQTNQTLNLPAVQRGDVGQYSVSLLGLNNQKP